MLSTMPPVLLHSVMLNLRAMLGISRGHLENEIWYQAETSRFLFIGAARQEDRGHLDMKS
jgi:hypothetical protein